MTVASISVEENKPARTGNHDQALNGANQTVNVAVEESGSHRDSGRSALNQAMASFKKVRSEMGYHS